MRGVVLAYTLMIVRYQWAFLLSDLMLEALFPVGVLTIFKALPWNFHEVTTSKVTSLLFLKSSEPEHALLMHSHLYLIWYRE